MHIFVADEHPLAVFANTCPRALQISVLRRLPRHSVWAGERGSGEARKWLPFYPSSKARPLAVD